MKQFTYIIQDKLGIHARPAGLIVKLAQSCTSDIRISLKDKTVNAKTIFAVMNLNAKYHDPLIFSIEGENEQEDYEKAKAFCEKNI